MFRSTPHGSSGSGKMNSTSFLLLRIWTLVYVLLTVFGTLSSTAVHAEPSTTTSSAEQEEVPAYMREDADWGTYYDPQKEFCGDKDCYKILGFDYEMFGKSPPDKKEITKRYRALSRAWHPDKSKKKGAKERFVVRIFFIIFSRHFVMFGKINFLSS